MSNRSVIFFGIVAICALSGCAEDSAKKQALALEAQCNAQYPYQAPTMAANVNCRNQAAETTIDQYYPYPDILQTFHDARLLYAQQADAGQITTAQAKLEIDQALNDAARDEQNRNSIRQQNAIAEQRVIQQQNFQQQQILQNIQNQYRQNLPVTTNCSTYRTQTSCTSQ